jgi:uncharacterized protein (TIGR03437 family)
MERKRKLVVMKAAVVLAVVPILLWAYEYGPNPGYVGIPSENGGATCATSGCHSGTVNNPANKGSVAVSFSGGTSYVPGVKQQVTVTISDPATTQAAWGFELTARLASNANTMAGSFTPLDNHTQIMCSATNLQAYDAYCLSGAGKGCGFVSAAPACPTNEPLQYMEHSYTGYLSTMGTGSGTYQFSWTPPATNVGNLTIYLAGNAGVPGPPTQDGDHIYKTSVTLTPSSGAATPTITGVSNSAGGQAGAFPSSWVSIYGSNFAPAGFTDFWDKSIVNGKLPTQLDNISVSIGGQPAYVYFVSSGQINVIAPNVGFGSMPVTVTANGTTSAAFTVNSQQYGPAFFPWPNSQPVATHADFTLAAKNGTFAGATTIPAKPGEAIILWGTGFGPTSPAAPIGVQIPATPTYYVATPATVTIGGNSAAVYATALAGGFAGLYQLVVTVPASMANGDFPVIATINGAQSPTGVLLTVHN